VGREQWSLHGSKRSPFAGFAEQEPRITDHLQQRGAHFLMRRRGQAPQLRMLPLAGFVKGAHLGAAQDRVQPVQLFSQERSGELQGDGDPL